MHIYGHYEELWLGLSKWRQKKREIFLPLRLSGLLMETMQGVHMTFFKIQCGFCCALWGLPFDEVKL